jgi:hypothetical protein
MSRSETRDGEDLVDAFRDRAGNPGQCGVWRERNEIAAPHAINKQGWNFSIDDGVRELLPFFDGPPLRPGSPRRLNDGLQIGIFGLELEETLRP